MSLFTYVVLFSLLGGVVSLAGGIGMLANKTKLQKHAGVLTAFAAGVLITISILDLLPETFELGNPQMAGMSVLIGVLLLFVMEKMSVWFHHHHEPHGNAPEITGVFLGDSLHNFIDGLAIGAAFLVSIPAGIATSVAVGMHELPQEIADFSLYIKAGVSKKKTLIMNVTSSFATLIGSLGVFFMGDLIEGIEVYILGLAAGMFLYIALADLIPELHETIEKDKGKIQLMMFFVGIGIAYLSLILLGHE